MKTSPQNINNEKTLSDGELAILRYQEEESENELNNILLDKVFINAHKNHNSSKMERILKNKKQITFLFSLCFLLVIAGLNVSFNALTLIVFCITILYSILLAIDIGTIIFCNSLNRQIDREIKNIFHLDMHSLISSKKNIKNLFYFLSIVGKSNYSKYAHSINIILFKDAILEDKEQSKYRLLEVLNDTKKMIKKMNAEFMKNKLNTSIENQINEDLDKYRNQALKKVLFNNKE